MRLFVAMDIPEEVRRAVGELVRKLEPVCRGARWVRVGGMHITLKFIGEVGEEKVAAIQKELAGVRSEGAVELRFRNVGFFPNARHPRVFWAGIEASGNLGPLAAEIEQRLERLGIAREKREFKPHLTLARFDSQGGLPKLREALEGMGPFEFGELRSSEFYLYQSELRRGGAVYTKLARFRFVEAAA
jgi:2'-5' RNA ligase